MNNKEKRPPHPKRQQGPVITFFESTKAYGCFSNFSRHDFVVEDRYYPSSEHYYQCQKFAGFDDDWAETIRNSETPKAAALLGRDPERQKNANPDWESLKEAVMYQGVLNKFLFHSDIAQILLETGDALIQETSPKDSYWGTGANGKGQNKLGIILMRVRQTLRERLPEA